MNSKETTRSAFRFYRFGPYELDLERHELRKFGVRLKLAPKPFQLLVALLDHSGNVVTRSELRQLLWGDGVFVDFEKGLRVAVTKLRAALNDSSVKPKYIDTVTGEGYRFIAAVQKIPLQPTPHNSPDNGTRAFDNRPSAQTSIPADEWEPTEFAIANERAGSLTAAVRKTWKIAVPGILLLAGLLAFYRSRANGQLSERDTIVLADFVNSTGDPVFDDTLKTAAGLALSQSPFLNLLSESRIVATLQMMMRPAATKLTPEIARDLCQRVGSKAYIGGTIETLGSTYVLTLKAVNCQTGDALAEEQVTASGKEKVLNALGEAASKLRRELGESLASVKRFDAPLEQVTTPSLEALKEYSLARRPALSEVGLPYLQRAVELDPNFATAYLLLAEGYDDSGKSERAQQCYRKAFQLQEHATEPERLAITVAYYANVTGELEKAAQIIEQEMATYPRAVAEYGDQTFVFENLGLYARAMELTRQNLHLDPEPAAPLVNIVHYSIALERFDEARQWLRNAYNHNVDNALLRGNAYYLAFLTNDSAGMAEQQDWFANHPEDERGGSLWLQMASDTEAYAGHLSKAHELTRQSITSCLRAGDKENAATSWEIAALGEAAFGDFTGARRAAQKGLALLSASRGIEAQAALAFAVATSTTQAESLAQDLNKRWPVDTQIQLLWLPTIQAQLALDRNDSINALNALQPTTTFEFGFSCLYSTYVRGEAYLAAGQGAAATTEFQKILDHRGIVLNCWTGALARLGIARANALQARTLQGADADAARLRALAAYRDFLTLWNGADPDIPVLKQAKTEYAKLQ